VIESTTVLFGLPGVQVTRVSRMDDGTRIVEITTDEDAAAACPSCGVFSTSIKARVTRHRRTFRTGKVESCCGGTRPDGDAGKRTASADRSPRPSDRSRAVLAPPAGCAPRSAQRSATPPARWPRSPPHMMCPGRPRTARSSSTQSGCSPNPRRCGSSASTRRGKPRWQYCKDTSRWVRVDPWDTGFVDLSSGQGLLGQREGRTTAAVVSWLTGRTPEFREAIAYVAIDPAAVYAAAVRTAGLLPNATLVVDHFHLVALANLAVTKTRRRVTWELKDRRGGKVDPEWANRRRLLTGRERVSDKNFAKMWNAILDEDPSAQILSAYIAKEELRTVLSTVRCGGDPHRTRHRLHRFLTWCIDSKIPELITLAKTVDAWWPAINAFVLTAITNARTEGYNRLVKTVKRTACGFRNPENSARRIRFHCTRTQRAAATQTSP